MKDEIGNKKTQKVKARSLLLAPCTKKLEAKS
jgi:hypothetical protein